MALYGHAAVYADKGYCYRELPPVEIVYILSADALDIGLHYVAEGVAGKPAVLHDRVHDAKVGNHERLCPPCMPFRLCLEYYWIKSLLFFHCDDFFRISYVLPAVAG